MQAQWLFQVPVGISITGWGRSELSLLKFVAFARSRDLEIPGPSLPRSVPLPEPFCFFSCSLAQSPAPSVEDMEGGIYVPFLAH